MHCRYVVARAAQTCLFDHPHKTARPGVPRSPARAVLQTVKAAPRQWHALDQPLLWQGSEDEALKAALPSRLTPPWKVILLSDGSVTRHLQLMTGLKIKVDCLEMQELGDDMQGLPEGTAQIEGPLLQRQVFLRNPDDDTALVYATSWWNAQQAKKYLANTSQPIWVSLSGIELLRDIQCVYHGHSAYLDREFGGERCAYWGRQYLFWHGGQPLTVIYEVFSPSLQGLLGPMYNETRLIS